MAKKIRIIPWLDESQLNKQLGQLGKKQQKIKVDIDNGNINNADRNIQQMNKTVANSNTIFGKLKNTIGSTFSSSKIALTGYVMLLNEISKAGKNAKQTIQDIDKAITDLSIATNQSRESVSGLVKDYNTYAKVLGSTTTQITSAADDYLRAGKSMNEAQALIKDSIMLSKLGQLDSSEATEDLLATMNGYAMSVEELERALDAMVAIDMEAATSSGDIATALKYCASSADVAGLSFNKLAAMIGAVQDKTQQSAETIGTFMNTLLSRYRDVKIGRFVDDDGESLSDVESVLNSLDIKLRNSSGEFREFETVINEVAQSWNSYSSVQQAAISKAFSGVRQQNRFIALMEGYNKTLELTEVAANSAGTAVEKFNSAYMNSIEAKQNTLQASFESMVINSDFDEIYSGILDATTALVDFINQTNALKGVFAGLAVSSGIKFFLSAKTGVTEAYIALNKFSNALKIAKQTNISTADFDKLLLLSNNLSASQMKLLLSSKNLSTAQKELILTNSGLSSAEAKLQLQTWGMVSAETGLTAATTTLGTAFKGLMATFAANPIMLVTMAVSGAVMAYQSYNQKLEETRQKNIEASEVAIEHVKSLHELYTEYNRLASIQGRTTSEEEAFKTAVEDITKALGNKADVLEGLTAGTNEYAEALAKATKEELLSASVDATVGRKSAEEELQNAIWSDWSGSKVSVNSNNKGKALSEETQKAVDIVSDALKEFETINRTWKNISWDISSDDPKEALAYYNALIKARKELVLASENDEELLNTEIYKDMNSAINTMSESLDSYIEKLYEEEKMFYMAQNSIPSTTEEYKAMEAAMINVAGESIDLQNKFKELLSADFSSLAVDIESVDDAVSNTATHVQTAFPLSNQLTASEEELNKFQTSLKSAYDAYAALMSGNYTSSELLDSIQAINQAATDMGKSFNWEAVEKLGTTDLYDSMELIGMGIEYISEEYAKSILSGAGINLNSDFGQMLTNIIIQEQKAQAEFGAMNTQLDNLQSSYQTLTDIIDSYNETGYISLDNLQSLLTADENLIQMLEVENGQLAINQEAYENLVAVQLLEFKSKLNDAAAAEIEMLAKNKAEEATNSNAQASEDAVAKLDAETAAFNRNTSAAISNAVAKAEEAGVSECEIQAVLDKYTEVWNSALNNFNVDFDAFMGGGKKAAGKSGKEAGDKYVEEFEKSLEELDRLRDEGKITEKEYLDSLRALYQKYFKDRKEYLKEYQKYENQYLKGMKSLYEDALSGITKLIDEQIDAYEEQKDAAVDALEAERDAALEALEAQIKKKEKIISSIQSEIDAMREANEERKRQIDLQDALYRQRLAENNRSKLVYNSEKGFTWETDTDAIRKARQDVEDAKFEIEIGNKEKQISLLEKEIDLLEERKDSTNEYYDKLIEDTEKYWDSLIKNMKDYRSQWDELASVLENAELGSIFEQLGISIEDILNMSGEAFEKFKGEYVGILADLYRDNDSMTNALAQSLGTTTDKLGSYIQSTQEYIDSLNGSADSLQPVSDAMDEASESMDTLSSSASSASSGVTNISSDMDSLNTSTTGLSDNINGISKALTDIPEADKFNAIVDAFTNLASAIQSVSDALGIGSEGTVGGLVGALKSINDISLGIDDGTGIISQFNNLKTAVESVTNAISGGALSSGQSSDSSTSASASMSFGAGGQDSASGLIGAINDIKTTTDTSLGSGGEEGSEGEGSGAIGKFDQLKTAVDDVSTAIGNEDSQDEENLIGSIVDLGENTKETLGETGGDGVIGRFEEFSGVIAEAEDHVQGINQGLDEINGKEVECTITINVKQNGSIPSVVGDSNAIGTAINTMNLNTAEYNAKLNGASHLEGTALVQGNWAVQSEEKNALLAEIGPEIVVRNGRYHVIGLNGAEMFHIKPGDIVFNAEQSAALLKYGKISGRGKAYADGTVGDPFASGKLRPLQPGDRAYELDKMFKDYMAKTGEDIHSFLAPVNMIQRDMEQMVRSINTINNIDNSNNRTQQVSFGDIHITCPGVTSAEVANQVGVELERQFRGLHLAALQESMKR